MSVPNVVPCSWGQRAPWAFLLSVKIQWKFICRSKYCLKLEFILSSAHQIVYQIHCLYSQKNDLGCEGLSHWEEKKRSGFALNGKELFSPFLLPSIYILYWKQDRRCKKPSRAKETKSDREAWGQNCRTLVPLFSRVWTGGNVGHLLP